MDRVHQLHAERLACEVGCQELAKHSKELSDPSQRMR